MPCVNPHPLNFNYNLNAKLAGQLLNQFIHHLTSKNEHETFESALMLERDRPPTTAAIPVNQAALRKLYQLRAFLQRTSATGTG